MLICKFKMFEDVFTTGWFIIYCGVNSDIDIQSPKLMLQWNRYVVMYIRIIRTLWKMS